MRTVYIEGCLHPSHNVKQTHEKNKKIQFDLTMKSIQIYFKVFATFTLQEDIRFTQLLQYDSIDKTKGKQNLLL